MSDNKAVLEFLRQMQKMGQQKNGSTKGVVVKEGSKRCLMLRQIIAKGMLSRTEIANALKPEGFRYRNTMDLEEIEGKPVTMPDGSTTTIYGTLVHGYQGYVTEDHVNKLIADKKAAEEAAEEAAVEAASAASVAVAAAAVEDEETSEENA